MKPQDQPTDVRSALSAALGPAFTLGRELGGGGMSRVFMAREEMLERDVVVKVLLPELAQGLSADRFAREMRLAAGLRIDATWGSLRSNPRFQQLIAH